VKLGRVERVPIVDDVAAIGEEAGPNVSQVSSDLSHPAPVRLLDDAGNLDPSGLEPNHDQHEVAHQASQRVPANSNFLSESMVL